MSAAHAPVVRTTRSALIAPCSVRTTAGRDRSRPVMRVRSNRWTPRSSSHAAEAARQARRLADRAVREERAPEEPRRVGACARLLGGQHLDTIGDPEALEHREPVAEALLPLAGARAHRPVLVEPAVDVVVGNERPDLVDRVRLRAAVAQARLLTEQPEVRVDVEPRRRQEPTVAPARATPGDVLLDQGDAEPGLSFRELDRGPQPGEPAADDAHVGHEMLLERRRRLARIIGERLLQPEAARGAGRGHVDHERALRPNHSDVTDARGPDEQRAEHDRRPPRR